MLEAIELSIETSRELNRVGPWLFLNAHDDGRLTAPGAFTALECAAFPHVCHITNQYRAATAKRYDTVADLFRSAHAADGLQHILLRPFGVHTRRGVLTGAANGIEQLGQ